MPLTEAQKIEIRAILRVRQEPAYYAPGKSGYTVLDEKLAALNADQIAEVEEQLARWAKVKYSTGILKGEFNDDPARTRSLIRSYLISILDFNPADYGFGVASFELERG